MNREENGVSATLPQALTYFSSSSSTAADHRWWLLRPRHERTVGRVRDGARQAALLGRLWQNDLRHRLRLQEPLAGLRGHKERTHQEGKGPEYWMMRRWPNWQEPGFGFSLSEFGARAGNWELLAIPGRVVVVGQIDFQAIQLSRLYLKEEELRVCAHNREGEWRRVECACVSMFWGRGIRRSPVGILFLEPI